MGGGNSGEAELPSEGVATINNATQIRKPNFLIKFYIPFIFTL